MEEILSIFNHHLPRMRISNAVNGVDIFMPYYWYLLSARYKSGIASFNLSKKMHCKLLQYYLLQFVKLITE